jgi:pyruvate dehydrogenase E1 component, homodimeric type
MTQGEPDDREAQNNPRQDAVDDDPQETQEWIDALESTLAHAGVERAHFLLQQLVDRARRAGAHLPFDATTAYINTIPRSRQAPAPGDPAIERRIRSLIRWNALAMVVHTNRQSAELGGHIASFASAATLYDVGFNHFFRAPSDQHGGDLIYIQGHSAPGIYARAFLEGRLTEDQLNNFRQEVGGQGLSSYPHPWLMPDFWQFSTVSMGLSSMMAIYQARLMKYLHDRGLQDAQDRKVWAFLGDGEMDEAESLGAITLAARERLDNLIFVVNCNLRLDGPVRGNGKIIQELEALFRGAGWNVIKVVWGSYWDPLLQRDRQGFLRKRFLECVDGEYQAFKAKRGAYTREKFFGKYPELRAMVASLSDEDIWRLNRGGHDPHKVFAAYAAAVSTHGQPTVILAKTVKGYGMGEAGEGQNITHQQKKMGEEALRAFRDRFDIPISDEDIGKAPFYRPPDDSPEIRYLRERRHALGGYLPVRRPAAPPLVVPPLESFDFLLKGSGEREYSTTMAFMRMLGGLTRDPILGRHVVPIVPDEARTFGMEGLFRQLGIYSSVGQLYEPVDAEQLMSYREAKDGQILEEGINEAGAMSSFIAAGTAYANHGINLIPFYCFYSMFGFQRTGDFAWAGADMRMRGFLMGGTSGRTTLAGEGLQHQDGHSHLLAASIPTCVAYDPTFAYEMAVIVQDGLRRMVAQQEDIFYYITMMNENYAHPAMPEGAAPGILKGLYLLRESRVGAEKPRVQLLGSGAILREVLAAADLLEGDFGVGADVWSVPSFTELRREGLAAERWSLLHPAEPRRPSFVETCLANRTGPVVAATDYVRLYADQIRPFVPSRVGSPPAPPAADHRGRDGEAERSERGGCGGWGAEGRSEPSQGSHVRRYVVLGTDGFGRSDRRVQLRHFFEVDRRFVALAALKALADEGAIPATQVSAAMGKLEIDPEKPDPTRV